MTETSMSRVVTTIAGFPHGNHRILAAAQEELDRVARQEARRTAPKFSTRKTANAWAYVPNQGRPARRFHANPVASPLIRMM